MQLKVRPHVRRNERRCCTRPSAMSPMTTKHAASRRERAAGVSTAARFPLAGGRGAVLDDSIGPTGKTKRHADTDTGGGAERPLAADAASPRRMKREWDA